MKRNILLACICLLFLSPLTAQENMVLNPGMESTAYNQPKSWILIGSVDFYRNRSLLTSGIRTDDEPEYPLSASGNNYFGIRSFDAGTEIAVARFSQPMVQDQWYRISCFARTSAVDCSTAMEGISVYPSDSILKTKFWYGAQPLIPFIILQPVKKGAAVSTEAWNEMFTYYKSKGGETFLWVGHFSKDSTTNALTTEAFQKTKDVLSCKSHIYYDSFAVERCLPPNQNRLTIHNITFDSGSHTVAEVADINMVYVVRYLRDYPLVNLSVEGHTDNEGSTQFNLELSQKRAAAVKNWLVEKGVEPARISTTGYGKSKPLGPQDTNAQKALNRRVEIVFN